MTLGRIAFAFAVLSCAAQPADACTPLAYDNPVRYSGGDLAEQIAHKAHTIQIVEASARHLLTREFERTKLFWETGRWRGSERYRDIYVFELQVIETLKGGEGLNGPARARAIDLGEDVHLWQSLGVMTQMVLNEPAPENRVISPVAVDPAVGSSCAVSAALRVGDRYLILRDARGDVLIPRFEGGEWTNFLPIDIETNDGSPDRAALQAPGIMEISPATDEFVARIRTALVRP